MQLVPDTCEIRFIFDGTGAYLGKRAEMKLYAKSEFGWSQLQVNELAQYAVDWWTSDLDALMNAAWTLTEVAVRDLGSEFGKHVTQTVGTAGALVGDELALNVAFVVQFEGEGASAPRNGWVSPPLGDESVVTDGLYTSAFANSVATSFQTFRDDLSTLSIPETTMVLVSRAGGTEAELAAVAAAREALREAIAATKRDTALTNDVGGIAGRRVPGSQRDRR